MLRKVNSAVIREVFLCAVSAVLLILSFPRANIGLFAWFGFAPLFYAIKNQSKIKAFLLSYFTGIIFWSGIIYWLVHVTLLGTIVLILYLALYFGIFGLIVRAIRHQSPSGRLGFALHSPAVSLIFIPSAWVLLEYIRSYLFTGLPWALLGYTQYLNLPIIQIADITGVWGVSFLVMMVNSALGFQLSAPSKKRVYILPVLLVAVVLSYGYFKLYGQEPSAKSHQLKVAAIQGNIAQELKWDPDAQEYIVNEYAQLSEEANKEKPDLIIWPEAAAPGVLGEDGRIFQGIFALSKKINTPLLAGSLRIQSGDYFNSALLIEKGKVTSAYDKLHLVPFGEFVPLKNIFPFLQRIAPIGDIAPGRNQTVFRINTDKGESAFSVLICFEDLFPELSRRFVKQGAEYIFNITNDAWYKRSSAPYQHLQASVFRAVENRVYLGRAANTGITAFIAPSGKVISKVENERGKDIFVSGYKIQAVSSTGRPRSFYTRYGDLFILICILFIAYGIALRFKHRKSK